MKIIQSIILVSATFFILNGCQENIKKEDNKEIPSNTENSNNVVSKDSIKYCFIKTFNKDTTTVNLTIENNKVSGTMLIQPYQKDKSTGLLNGVKDEAGEMKLVYNYMQEGMKQSQTMVMKINGNQLFIKKGELVDIKNDGNLTYKDEPNAPFSEILEKISCK